MTRDKYEKIALPQIKSIVEKFGVEFSEIEYDQVVDEAFQMVNTATTMYKRDVTQNPLTHKEILRSSIINVYKRNHKAPYMSMIINIVGCFMVLKYYLEIVSPWCEYGSFNYWIAILTCGIVLYRVCKSHNSFMDKIIPYRMKIKRWKKMLI
jgi:hypothetical protein